MQKAYKDFKFSNKSTLSFHSTTIENVKSGVIKLFFSFYEF